jgi:hypothetical protein
MHLIVSGCQLYSETAAKVSYTTKKKSNTKQKYKISEVN